MKKILVLALVIAMVASMGVTATATQGTGTIVFQAFGDTDNVPARGIHNPLDVGTAPPGTWLAWPNTNVPTPTQMHSWNISFGTRDMPAPGTSNMQWGSHIDAGAGLNNVVGGGTHSDLLGLLVQEGWSAGTPPVGGVVVTPQASQRLQASLGQFQHTATSTPTMSSFDLTLGTPAGNNGLVGFRPSLPALATGSGGTTGWLRPGTAPVLAQQSVVTPVAGFQTLLEFQRGQVGAQWWGRLAGDVDATSSNVVPGEAQAQIVFRLDPIV